jgi:hypothetical protein
MPQDAHLGRAAAGDGRRSAARLLALLLLVLASAVTPGRARAQVEPVHVRVERAFDSHDVGLRNPKGLAYSPAADLLYVLEASAGTGATIVTLATWEERLGETRVAVSLADPINLTYDAAQARLLLLDSGAREIVAIPVATDGMPAPAGTPARYSIGALGLLAPRGMAVDPASGALYILDAAALRVVRVDPGAEGDLDGAAALGAGRVSRVDLAPAGLVSLRGLALHPHTGHLATLSSGRWLFEFLPTGEEVAILALPPGELVDPQGLAFGLSGDATDPPTATNLYLADTGLVRASTGLERGRIVELRLAIVHVPGEAPTVQAGLDLAADGDLVLVAPGTYRENVTLRDKAVTLASWFHTTRDPRHIRGTILDGDRETVITVEPTAGPSTEIVGLTIQNGDDGISADATLSIRHNYFTGNRDAIDYESGGGECLWNVFDGNRDDAIDLDGPTAAHIEGNTIRNSRDDGIEIRLHRYNGPLLETTIRGNTIADSGEDGIQVIDYPGLSDRVLRIERNHIARSADVGLGMMADGVTTEDYSGAPIPERIYLVHNTLVGNGYGITGGHNLVAVNNIIAHSTHVALKNIGGDSVVAHTLLWGNGTDAENANVVEERTVRADPRLDAAGRLLAGSPAIDAGTVTFVWQGETVVNLPADSFHGAAPDLGALEHYLLPQRLHRD